MTIATAISASAPVPQRLRVAVNLLMADPGQPRKHFDQEALRGLGESIKADGQLQPIIVRERDNTPDKGENYGIEQPRWLIVDGERRWRAVLLMRLAEVDIEVRPWRAESFEARKSELRSVQLVANLQREGLTLAEECSGISKYLRALDDELLQAGRTGESTLEIAALRLGKSKAWVSKRAGVERLRPEIRDLLTNGLVGDVEILHGLERLAELDPGECNEIIVGLNEYGGNTADEEIVSRARVRELVREAQERAEAEAHAPEEQSGAEPDLFTEQGEGEELAQPTAPPAVSTAPAPPSAAPGTSAPAPAVTPAAAAPNPAAERLRHATQLQAAVREFEQAATARLCQAFRLRHDAQQPFNGEANIYSARLISETSPILARDAESNDYFVALRGDLDKIRPAADALIRFPNGKPTEFSCSLALTLAQARRVQKALGRPLLVETKGDLMGSTISLVLKRVAPSRKRPSAVPAKGTRPAEAQKPEQSKTGETPKPVESVNGFLKACVQPKKGARVLAGDLHAAYVAYCERHGVEALGPAHPAYTMPITLAGIKRVKSNGVRYCVGIEILVETE